VHVLLILLLVLSTRTPAALLLLDDYPEAGVINLPAGGGGGGTLGSGGRPTRQERVEYLELVPPKAVEVPQLIEKKDIVKPPPPVIKIPELKPPEIKPPEPPPPVDSAVLAAVAAAGSIDTTLTGRGGGTGNDGTAGNGSGTGGGIGTGDGTGRGSGSGPGIGGRGGNIYSPHMILTPLLPDAPSKLRPYECVAVFDVDVNGAVLGFNFNRTGDRGYDRSVEAVLKTVRFRPAVDLEGRPVRASAKITFSSK
jgi:protein TonB